MSGPTLVTGAGGFLGGHVVAALAAGGEAVRALDIAFPAALPAEVERIDGSILDQAALAGALAGAGAVIHCAAIADLWAPSRWAYDRVNMRGTCEVLIAARGAGARVVHVSSYVTLIGGEDQGEATLDETVELTPTDMLGPYPRSKREAELAVLSAARMGQDAVIVLPSAPVGPGDHRLTPPSRMIRDLAAGKTPAVLDCLLNLVDVRALAEGIIAARDRGRGGERYLLTGEDLTMAELAAKVAELAGVAAPRFQVPHWLALAAARAEAGVSALTGRPPKAPLTGVRLAARRVRFDNAKARAELGFSPPPVDRALADAVAWMREAGLLG
ncbi:MAG: NAD-dependent epimerase/dehydratase family protein [Alphaproteobacteria bacterium]